MLTDPMWQILQPGSGPQDLGRVEQYIGPTGYPTVNIPPPAPTPPQPTAAPMATMLQPAAVPPAAAPQQPQVPPAAAPAAAPAAPPDAQKPSRWGEFLSGLADPKVLGPLQTFLGSMTVPLRPGENMASRLAYSSTLMQIHKRMLEENEVNLPLQQREKEAKIRQAEAQAEGVGLDTQYKRETMSARVQKALQDFENAGLTADKAKLDIAEQELKNALIKEFGAKEAQAKLDMYKAQAGMLNRSPRAGGSSGVGTASTQQELRSFYESEIFGPYKQWGEAKIAVDPTADISWVAYHNENPQQATLYRQWSAAWKKAGGSMGPNRREEVGSNIGKKRYQMDAQGNIK